MNKGEILVRSRLETNRAGNEANQGLSSLAAAHSCR